MAMAMAMAIAMAIIPENTYFFCNMDGRLLNLSTHRPRRGLSVNELKRSAPFGPLKPPRDQTPRGFISPCVFGPQGILSSESFPSHL